MRVNAMHDFHHLVNELNGIQLEGACMAASSRQVPDRREVIILIKECQALMFPGYFRVSDHLEASHPLVESIYHRLIRLVKLAEGFGTGKTPIDAESISKRFLDGIPGVKSLLCQDAMAIFQGDPAASSCEEVIICYPGFYALSVQRLAHTLYQMDLPLIPRVMTEYAHEKTGIDIHAGAKIGQRFCIDHGTGVVVGETTVIGNDVKLYQGVTLGAKSFPLDENGHPIKGIKRHPQIGDRVIIYANAVILGGDTQVGNDCVIGGNVWLTHSIPSGSTLSYDGSRTLIKG